MKKMLICLDKDDVLMKCNSLAVEMLNREKNSSYSKEDITEWGLLGNELDERLKFFKQKSFVRKQTPLPGAVEFVKELQKYADVYICTNVPVECAGECVESIIEHFPIAPQNIIIGSRKDLIHADFQLDDNVDNLQNANVTYPVLMQQPWNSHVTGMARVSSYEGFLRLVKMVTSIRYRVNPKLIALVGCSGSNKNEIAKALCKEGFAKVISYTDRPQKEGEEASKYHFVSKQQFRQMKEEGLFLETTGYACGNYGITKESIDEALAKTSNGAVVVTDINGALELVNAYNDNVEVIFCKNTKQSCIENILLDVQNGALTIAEATNRLQSIDGEKKNEVFCDTVIDSSNVANAVLSIKGVCGC